MNPRPLTAAEIVEKIHIFRALTNPEPDSDMNQLLNDLLRGKNPIITAWAAEVDAPFLDAPLIVGWAVCDVFKGWVFTSVFVHPSCRGRGFGTKLASAVLSELDRIQPRVRRFCPEDNTFWRRIEHFAP